jgi:hypothetical protein
MATINGSTRILFLDLHQNPETLDSRALYKTSIVSVKGSGCDVFNSVRDQDGSQRVLETPLCDHHIKPIGPKTTIATTATAVTINDFNRSNDITSST